MEPRLTRAEYWLLESVVEYSMPFCVLAFEEIDEALNKPGHGLDRRSLLDVLDDLTHRGLIAAHDDQREGFAPTREEIDAALDEPTGGSDLPSTYYHLTPEGGRQWEAFAAPDWDAFIDVVYGTDVGDRWEEGSLICATKPLVERFLEGLQHLGIHVQPDSPTWDVLEPWQATYWKQLPMGHRVRYQCRAMAKAPDPAAIPLGFLALGQWYRWR